MWPKHVFVRSYIYHSLISLSAVFHIIFTSYRSTVLNIRLIFTFITFDLVDLYTLVGYEVNIKYVRWGWCGLMEFVFSAYT